MNQRVANRIHLLCAWSGLAFALLTLVGIIFLAKFFPPPSPTLATDAVVALYQDNLPGIRAAMVVMMMGAALFIPFTSLIAHYLIRIEGRVGVISIMQIMGGYSNMLLFFYPCLWWLTASFRMERDPQLIQMLHDAAWLQFLGAIHRSCSCSDRSPLRPSSTTASGRCSRAGTASITCWQSAPFCLTS